MRTQSFLLHGHFVTSISISLRVRHMQHTPTQSTRTLFDTRGKHISPGYGRTQLPTADKTPSFLERKSGKFHVSFRRRNLNNELSNKISRTLRAFPNPTYAHRRTLHHAFRATLHLTNTKRRVRRILNLCLQITSKAICPASRFDVRIKSVRVYYGRRQTVILVRSNPAVAGEKRSDAIRRGPGDLSGVCNAADAPFAHPLSASIMFSVRLFLAQNWATCNN